MWGTAHSGVLLCLHMMLVWNTVIFLIKHLSLKGNGSIVPGFLTTFITQLCPLYTSVFDQCPCVVLLKQYVPVHNTFLETDDLV